ncbi:unnamed protein product [Adineta ricciae]|uniref:Uncharacterized protein n=1 Tax=Adineta ricciae TaxID=249248 RepID=A0A814XQ52_ADIRI|nr:unnamed protein product [Adineta ricciae]CAF1311092.1 unnamed protein product [Adineta ricciae]
MNCKVCQEIALPTILGGLKLCDEDPTSKNPLNKYKSVDTLYDVIIRINNLSDLRSEEWEILVGKHTKCVIPIPVITDNSNEPLKASSEVKEGVVAYNRGKTYLLRKLRKVELPSGNLMSTEGTSIAAGRETISI